MGDNADYITKLINRFPDKHDIHYQIALSEINSGKKIGHWIWYLIPTPPYIVDGKVKVSGENKEYALRDYDGDITGKQAAKAYLNYNQDGVNLGENYYNLLNAIDKQINNYKSAEALLKNDVKKLKSSVILFKNITDDKTDGINKELYTKINTVCSNIITKLQLPNKDVDVKKDGKKVMVGNGEKDGYGDGEDGDGEKVRAGDGGDGEDGEDGDEEDEEDEEDGDGKKVMVGDGEKEEEDGEVKCFFKLINDEPSGEEYKIFVKNTRGNDAAFSTILEQKCFNYIIYSDSKKKVLIINVKREYSLKNILDKINNIKNICDDIIIISKEKDDNNINLIFIYNTSVQSIIEILEDTKSTIKTPISYDEYDVIKNDIIIPVQDVNVDVEDKDKAIKTAINNYRKKKAADEAADISDKYFNLIWENNSCYMHSLFVSLFHFNNKYIYDMIRANGTITIEDNQTNILSNLIKNLKIIYEKINGLNKKDTKKYTCVDFRQSLQDFHNSIGYNKDKQIRLKDELNVLEAELDILKAKQKGKKQKVVRQDKEKQVQDKEKQVQDKEKQVQDKKTEYKDEVEKWTGVYEDPSVLYDELSNNLYFNKIASLMISSTGDITRNIGDSIDKDSQIINYINKGKVLIIFIEQSRINRIKYEDAIIIEKITLKLRSIIFNTKADTKGDHYFAVIKEGKRIYIYDDFKKETTKVITSDDEKNLQDTDKITGLIYSADTVCSSFDASMFYIRPYGVLGKQLTKKKADETNAVEIEIAKYPTADSYAFCDPAGLTYIKDKTDVKDADGASKAIYEFLHIKNKPSGEKKINNSFGENVKKGITKETDAKYAEYTISPDVKVKCIHIVGPDFRTENDTDNMIKDYDNTNIDIQNAIEKLSDAYYNVLIEFILTEAPALRLLPISGDIFAGKFKNIMPQITYESLNVACGKIKSKNNDYATHLCEKELNMCIYDEEDYNKYEEIWYKNIP